MRAHRLAAAPARPRHCCPGARRRTPNAPPSPATRRPGLQRGGGRRPRLPSDRRTAHERRQPGARPGRLARRARALRDHRAGQRHQRRPSRSRLRRLDRRRCPRTTRSSLRRRWSRARSGSSGACRGLLGARPARVRAAAAHRQSTAWVDPDARSIGERRARLRLRRARRVFSRDGAAARPCPSA